MLSAERAVFMPSQSRSARQLPRTRGSQNVTFRFGLPRLRGSWTGGPVPKNQPPQRDPIFRDAKVLLFWCDQQQKEHWLGIPFCCHIGRVCTRACKRSLIICRPLTSNTVWCSVLVISRFVIESSLG